MKITLHWSAALATLSLLGTTAISQRAIGQEPAPNALQEIVVTAQKRTENVQDVPIAISVFTASALQERSIADVASISNIAPNVTLDAGTPFSGSTQVLAAYIRGIGANDFAMNLDPGVGIYLDGVYLARTIGANVDLPDVERVEILKGPQGTLFGRNAVGGAISIVTRDPRNEFGLSGDLITGRFNRLDVRGTVDLPIADSISSIVTFSVKTRDGYQRRQPYAGNESFVTDQASAFGQTGFESSTTEGGQDEWTGRAKFKWTPSDRITVRVGGDYSHVDNSAAPNSVLAVNADIPGNFAGLAANNIPGTAFDPTGTSGFLFAGLYNFCIGATPNSIAARNAQALCGSRGTPLNPGKFIGGIGSVNVDGDPFNDRLPIDQRWVSTDKDISHATGNSFSKLNSWGINATVDFDLGEDLALKSITGYRHLNWKSGLDLDNSPLQVFEPSFSLKQWQVSQEVQLLGSFFDKSVKYVLGGYYFKEAGKMRDYVTFAQGLLQIYGPNDLNTKNHALFGQIDWRVNSLLGLTLGGRYTKERKDFLGGQLDFNGFNYKLFNCPVYGDPCSSILGFPDPTQPLRYYVPGLQQKDFSNFSPKVGAQLHLSEAVMLYSSWSRGYKTGGWTTRLSNPLLSAPDFDEEKAATVEVGLKSTWLDHRLQMNAAVFTTKYEGIQLNFQEGVSPTIKNAGDARIKGAEVEVIAAPLAGLTINASIGYLDAYYLSVDAGGVVVPNFYQAGIFAGADLPKTPKWKANLSPRFQFNVGDRGRVTLIADYTHTSKVWNDTERTYLLARPTTDNLNLSAAYASGNDKWSLTFGVTNATNARTITSGTNLLANGLIFGSYDAPVEWYAQLGLKL